MSLQYNENNGVEPSQPSPTFNDIKGLSQREISLTCVLSFWGMIVISVMWIQVDGNPQTNDEEEENFSCITLLFFTQKNTFFLLMIFCIFFIQCIQF